MILQEHSGTDWQQSMREMIRAPEELLALLELSPEQLHWTPDVDTGFPLRVPRPFARRIRRGDPTDPLLLQVLPRGEELRAHTGFVSDPLQEARANVRPGLVHKYRDRALLIAATACAAHCRYCFRRHFPYEDNRPDTAQWERALDYIASQPEIHEVILSGGDPLVLRDSSLGELAVALARLPQLRRLRIHTRLPILIPARISDALLEQLAANRLHPAVFVVHCNHANEIDAEVREALLRLRGAGHTVLNQAVLLKGVNDSAAALVALSEALFDCGTLPYYLHLPDRVAGTAHFYVGARRGRQLLGQAAARLPGYLLPRLVREIPGAPAKQCLAPLLPEPGEDIVEGETTSQ